MLQIRYVVVAIILSLTIAGSALAWPWGSFSFKWGGRPKVAQWIDLLPSLAWNPATTIAFGNVSTGAVRVASRQICNTGNDVAEDVVLSVSSPFRIYSSPTGLFNISAGSCQTAKVAFNPQFAIAYSGFLNYSAPNIARTSLAVSGTGYSALSTPSVFWDASSTTLNTFNAVDGSTVSLTGTTYVTGYDGTVSGAVNIPKTAVAYLNTVTDTNSINASKGEIYFKYKYTDTVPQTYAQYVSWGTTLGDFSLGNYDAPDAFLFRYANDVNKRCYFAPSGVNLFDGNWHTVRLQWDKSLSAPNARLILDTTTINGTTAKGGATPCNIGSVAAAPHGNNHLYLGRDGGGLYPQAGTFDSITVYKEWQP